MSYPHGQKQGFFPLSEGPSVMTDPELLGKTAVFPFSRITARSSKQSPIQKRPLAIILEVILYRIRANRQRLLRIPKTMYRNSPFFATKSKKIMPPVRMARDIPPSENAGIKNTSAPKLSETVQLGCLTLPYPEIPVIFRQRKQPGLEGQTRPSFYFCTKKKIPEMAGHHSYR